MPAFACDDGTTLSYRVVGSGPRDLMLVHGWSVSGAVWDALLEGFDATGLRLIIPDLRGTGGSGKPEQGYALDRYAKDLAAVAAHAGSSRYVVVGHSMGGQIAQYLAAVEREHVAGAVLACPVPASGMQLPPDAAGLFRTSAGNRGQIATIFGLACKQLTDAARERMLDDATAIPAACIEQAFDAWTGASFADKLDAVQAPTLVVGTDDPFLPPAFLREAVVSKIRSARLAVIPGPGHYVQVEAPALFAALLQGFLAGLP